MGLALSCGGCGLAPPVRVVQRAKKLVPVDDRHPTEASVRRYAEEVLRPLNDQRRSGLIATTMGDFAERIYLPHVSDQNRLSTYRGLPQHLAPVPGVRLSLVVGARCADVRGTRSAPRYRSIASPVARRTLAHIKAFLSGCSTMLSGRGYFDAANPVHGVSIPKTRLAGETYAYSLEEVMHILSTLPQPPATIAATSGVHGATAL